MSLSRTLPLLAAALALAIPAQTQQTPTTIQRDPQALEILQASLAVMGGSYIPQATQGQRTILASGTRTLIGTDPPIPNAFRVKILGLQQVRWEVDYPEGTAVIVEDQASAWGQSPAGTTPISVGDSSGWGLELLPLIAIANWLSDPSVKVVDAGLEDSGGTRLRHLTISHRFPGDADDTFQATYERATQCEIFLDLQTLLPLRLRYYEHPGDWRRNVPLDVVFSRFTPTNGVLWPGLAVLQASGKTVETIEFKSVSFGVPLSSDEFQAR